MPSFLGTIFTQPRQRPPPIARARPAGTTLGMSSPSIYEPLPQLDRRWHQPCVGESEWSDDTTVASMASWPPPNKVNPSATTSRRRKSLLCGDAILTVDTLGFVLPRYLSDGTLCCKTPPVQKRSCAARCSVVAKSVEWTATPAGACNERQGGADGDGGATTRGMARNPTWTRGGLA